MKPIISQTLRAVLQATMGGFLLSACADRVDAPTGPGAFAPDQSTLAKVSTPSASSGQSVRTGGHLNPLKVEVVASAMIGPKGGVLALPSLGFELVVPPGAVAETMKFRVTAVPGSTLAYEFEPHGAKFQVPLTFRQDGRYTSVGWGQAVNGGYFTDPTKVDQKGKKAEVNEVMPGRWNRYWIEFDIRHFSGYLVSMG